VGIFAVGAHLDPILKVKAFMSFEGQGIAVELVNDHAQVAVGGELVCHELAILPYANHVGDVEDTSSRMRLVGRGSGNVGLVFVGNLDNLAGRLTTTKFMVMSVAVETTSNPELARCWSSIAVMVGNETLARWRGEHEGSHLCLTPMVQHCPGGLDAMILAGKAGAGEDCWRLSEEEKLVVWKF